MRTLVTGAGGMLGRDVVTAAERSGHEVTGLTRADVDITDADALSAAIRQERPDAVINCAAYTDVDGAESEPDAAHAVNAVGAGNVARAAAAAEALVVHVSTDYVFDGSATRPYVETDEPSPLGAYARSKLIGEIEVAGANPRHLIARSSWLFGGGKRNFVETMLSLARERREVSVVVDQVGSPTWTGHLAGALVGLADRPAEGLHHLAAAGSCSWHAFAVEIFRQAGVDCRVVVTTSERLDRAAPRPAYSVLHSARSDTPRLPPWQDGLAAYLDERAERAPSSNAGVNSA
jgi:dTDP-4-dehydrorhamnose reductase